MSFRIPTPEAIREMSRDELQTALKKACEEIRSLHLKADCQRLSSKMRPVQLMDGKVS